MVLSSKMTLLSPPSLQPAAPAAATGTFILARRTSSAATWRANPRARAPNNWQQGCCAGVSRARRAAGGHDCHPLLQHGWHSSTSGENGFGWQNSTIACAYMTQRHLPRRRFAARAGGGTPNRCPVGPGIVATSQETSACAREGRATHVGGGGLAPSRNGGT